MENSVLENYHVGNGPPVAEPWAVPGIADHPQREALTNEIHARPSIVLRAPVKVSHLALLSGERAAEQDRQAVARLCRRFGVAEPNQGVNYWHADLGMCRLNWERHTEFSTYTFYRHEAFGEPFRDVALDQVPRDWLEALAGAVLVAIHVALADKHSPEPDGARLHSLFASDNVAASQVSGGAAKVWSDFRLQGDGFSRFYVYDAGLRERQAGRLVQRLLEIETYRMMALLTLPRAREIGQQVSQAEERLVQLTANMSGADPDAERNDHALLEQLTALAAEIERLAAGGNYRFSAARAYYALVQRRISELREQRLPGHAPIQEFMERRLAPAMRTCESVSDRLAALSERIARAANLLRTRVDVALESQNRDLLDSMDRRASMQLRLQQTVEGLSVVVLSYYLTGLVGYLLKSAKAAGADLDVELLTGLAVVPIVAGVWLGTRWVRHKVVKQPG